MADQNTSTNGETNTSCPSTIDPTYHRRVTSDSRNAQPQRRRGWHCWLPAVQIDNEAIFTNAAVLVSPIFPELNLKAEEILPNIGAIKNN
jgi:hypothetical protein